MRDKFKKFRNPDGKTFNGVKMFAELTGVSEAEIQWTFDRLKQLQVVEGKSKEDAKRIVTEEARLKPWITKPNC